MSCNQTAQQGEVKAKPQTKTLILSKELKRRDVPHAPHNTGHLHSPESSPPPPLVSVSC